MTLTNEELRILRESLPHGAISEIAKKIKMPNRKKISYRMVQYILQGLRSDQHGVIDMALEIARKKNEQNAKLRKGIKSLSK